MSANVGMTYRSRLTERFKWRRSTHTRIPDVFLVATTMGAHQWVGSVCFTIMSMASIFSSISLRGCIKGNGTCRGALTLYGVDASCSVIWVNGPLNLLKGCSTSLRFSFTKFICCAALWPNKLLVTSATYTRTRYRVVLYTISTWSDPWHFMGALTPVSCAVVGCSCGLSVRRLY